MCFGMMDLDVVVFLPDSRKGSSVDRMVCASVECLVHYCDILFEISNNQFVFHEDSVAPFCELALFHRLRIEEKILGQGAGGVDLWIKGGLD
jgi:hypothetical protein